MKKFLQTLAAFLAIFSAGMAGLLYLKNRAPKGYVLWFPKLLAGALAPVWGLAGALGGLLGLVSGAPLAALLGGWGGYTAWGYLKKVATPGGVTPGGAAPKVAGPQGALQKAFSPQAEQCIPPRRAAHLPEWRWDWTTPPAPEPRCQRDLAFWTLENGRELLCDLRQPPAGTSSSGLAVLYFHGSYWYMMDKGVGTRSLFRHLAAQGHLVMDVAYRLAPEASLADMVGDVKRALAWIKSHAAEYGVDPQRVVLMGSSAGGHLSMLAGFAPYHPEMTPAEVKDADLYVRAVVSLYGPCDLAACYFHTNQNRTTGHLTVLPAPAPANPEMAARLRRMLGDRYERWGLNKDWLVGSFLALLGGHPDQVPEAYKLFSPLSHVHPGCPPVFLAQGEDDLITPIEATRSLVRKLQQAGVPVFSLVFPLTDHGFELVLPAVNPATRAMLYDLDRFLARL